MTLSTTICDSPSVANHQRPARVPPSSLLKNLYIRLSSLTKRGKCSQAGKPDLLFPDSQALTTQGQPALPRSVNTNCSPHDSFPPERIVPQKCREVTSCLAPKLCRLKNSDGVRERTAQQA